MFNIIYWYRKIVSYSGSEKIVSWRVPFYTNASRTATKRPSTLFPRKCPCPHALNANCDIRNVELKQFLALLDYVSRAHEIEIRPSSVVRRPSVRLWHRLSLKLLYGFLSNFSCGLPWAICPDVFFILKKKTFLNFLRIFFVFVNMGPYGSKIFKTLLLLQMAAESFQTFPEFSS